MYYQHILRQMNEKNVNMYVIFFCSFQRIGPRPILSISRNVRLYVCSLPMPLIWGPSLANTGHIITSQASHWSTSPPGRGCVPDQTRRALKTIIFYILLNTYILKSPLHSGAPPLFRKKQFFSCGVTTKTTRTHTGGKSCWSLLKLTYAPLIGAPFMKACAQGSFQFVFQQKGNAQAFYILELDGVALL